jgi:hypothetical protein
MTDSSPFSTPKRKRSEMLNDAIPKLNTTAQFTFDVNSALDDGNASPRTRVAHRFRGLALGGGGGGGPSADLQTIDNDDEVSRKRVKLPDVEMLDTDSPAAAAKQVFPGSPSLPRRAGFIADGSPSRKYKSVRILLDDAVVEQSESLLSASADDNDDTTTPSLTPSSPPPPSRSQPQPRTRPFKRAGTPPFTTKPKPTTSSSSTNPTITDPLRASLTWHDDEITIYDPDDSDDDGTGINGIGFKPTPAIAYARTVRRRQQLAEYKKREEKEARAKRSLRRRGASPAPGVLEIAGSNKSKGKGDGGGGGSGRRRVRFLEREGVVVGG